MDKTTSARCCCNASNVSTMSAFAEKVLRGVAVLIFLNDYDYLFGRQAGWLGIVKVVVEKRRKYQVGGHRFFEIPGTQSPASAENDKDCRAGRQRSQPAATTARPGRGGSAGTGTAVFGHGGAGVLRARKAYRRRRRSQMRHDISRIFPTSKSHNAQHATEPELHGRITTTCIAHMVILILIAPHYDYTELILYLNIDRIQYKR